MQFSKSAMVSFLLLAAACSSTTTVTNTDSGTTPDAALKDSAAKDTGTTSDAGTCTPQDVTSFAPATDPSPAAPASGCTDPIALAYYNACVAAAGTQSACDAITQAAANAACVACLVTPDTASKWGALIQDSQSLLRNNIAGCLTVKGDAACGTAVSQSSQCSAAACPDTVCPVPSDDTGAALDALNACEAKADTLGCKTYADKANCLDTSDGGTAAAQACTAPASSTDDFKDTFLKVAHVICVAGN